MSIYERPTKSLMTDWASQHLIPGQIFGKADVSGWFSEKYPKIKSNTVRFHIDGMCTNNPDRKHQPKIKPGSGHDLFYKLGPEEFRLWNQESDPQPLYKHVPSKSPSGSEDVVEEDNNSELSSVLEVTDDTADQSSVEVETAVDASIDAANPSVAMIPNLIADMSEKTFSTMEHNSKAMLDHVTKLAYAKDFQEVVRLQTEFVKSQYAAAAERFKEMISGANDASGAATIKK